MLKRYIIQGLEGSEHIFFLKVIVRETNTEQVSRMVLDQEYETGQWDTESLEETIVRMIRSELHLSRDLNGTKDPTKKRFEERVIPAKE